MTRHRASRALISEWFPPLTDPAGMPYEPAALPCASTAPIVDEAGGVHLYWDAEATGAEHRHAQMLCRYHCPALLACRRRRRQLGPEVEGVWGAMIRRPKSKAQHDPQVSRWAREAGVELPEPSEP